MIKNELEVIRDWEILTVIIKDLASFEKRISRLERIAKANAKGVNSEEVNEL